MSRCEPEDSAFLARGLPRYAGYNRMTFPPGVVCNYQTESASQATRRRKQARLDDRLAAIEDKLHKLESMLTVERCPPATSEHEAMPYKLESRLSLLEKVYVLIDFDKLTEAADHILSSKSEVRSDGAHLAGGRPLEVDPYDLEESLPRVYQFNVSEQESQDSTIEEQLVNSNPQCFDIFDVTCDATVQTDVEDWHRSFHQGGDLSVAHHGEEYDTDELVVISTEWEDLLCPVSVPTCSSFRWMPKACWEQNSSCTHVANDGKPNLLKRRRAKSKKHRLIGVTALEPLLEVTATVTPPCMTSSDVPCISRPISDGSDDLGIRTAGWATKTIDEKAQLLQTYEKQVGGIMTLAVALSGDLPAMISRYRDRLQSAGADMDIFDEAVRLTVR